MFKKKPAADNKKPAPQDMQLCKDLRYPTSYIPRPNNPNFSWTIIL